MVLNNASVQLDLNSLLQEELSALVWSFMLAHKGSFIYVFTSTDRDECLSNPCEQLCINTIGSFECTCMSGYELQIDEITCEGEKIIVF